MPELISVLLIIAGLIHLLPLSGVLGAERLAVLYGQSFDDPNLLIMMRHRAVLFGLLGTLLLAAAFVTWLRPLALGAGLVSVISFILLAKLSPGYNEALRKVVIADWVALVGLLLALALLLMQQRDNLG